MIHFSRNRCSFINTLYGCKTTIVFTLKMKSVTRNTISGLKMMVKSGLRNYFEIPTCWKMVTKFVNLGKNPSFHEVRKISLSHGEISKQNFLDHNSPSFLGQKWYFWTQIPF